MRALVEMVIILVIGLMLAVISALVGYATYALLGAPNGVAFAVMVIVACLFGCCVGAFDVRRTERKYR